MREKRVLWPWDFAKILLDSMLTALENQRVPGSTVRGSLTTCAEGFKAKSPIVTMFVTIQERHGPYDSRGSRYECGAIDSELEPGRRTKFSSEEIH
jgi:hypothetical protein